MKCPVDKEILKTEQAYGQTIDVCPNCHGVWFDYEELGKITEKFDFGDFKDFKKWKGIIIEGEPSKSHWQEPVRTCQRDYSEMKRHTFAGDSKIHIDRCIQCGGFWFDGEDITRLIEYFEPNKVAEAMGRAIVKSSQEFEEAKRQLAEFPIKLIHALQNPTYLIYLVVVGIVNLIIDDLKNNETF